MAGMVVGDVQAILGLEIAPFVASLEEARGLLTEFRAAVAAPAVLGAVTTGGTKGGGAAVAAAAPVIAAAPAVAAPTKLLTAQEIALGKTAGATKLLTAQQIALNKANTQLHGSTAVINNDAKKLSTNLDDMAEKARRAGQRTREAGDSAKHSETSFGTLARTLVKASAVFMGIMVLKGAITAVTDSIKYAVGVAAQFEQTTIGFTKLFGSAAAAKAKLKELAEFASRTPFELVDTEQQALRLKAYGFAAAEVIPILTDVGDAASGLGTGQEGINRITLALGQMRSAGRVNSRDMLQLTEAFVPAWQYIADALGTTTGQVRKMTEKGLIPAEQAIKAIRAGMQRDFGGMMSEQMKTLLGQWSNFKDKVTIAARSVGQEILPALKSFVSQAATWLPKIEAYFTGIVKGTNDTGMALRNLANAVKIVAAPVEVLLKVFSDVNSMFTSLLAGNIGNVFKKMWENIPSGIVFLGVLVISVTKLIMWVDKLALAWLGVAGSATTAAIAQAAASKGGAAGAAGAAAGKKAADMLGTAGAGAAGTQVSKLGKLIQWLKNEIKLLPAAWNLFTKGLATLAIPAGFTALVLGITKLIRPGGLLDQWSEKAEMAGARTSTAMEIAATKGSPVVTSLHQPGVKIEEPKGIVGKVTAPPAAKPPAWDSGLIKELGDEYKMAVRVFGEGSVAARAAYDRLSVAVKNANSEAKAYTFTVNEAKSAAESYADALEKAQVPGLNSVDSAQKGAIDSAVALSKAQAELKDTPKGTAQYAAALLNVQAASGVAAQALKLYQQAAVEAALANQYGGELAAWAASAVVNGANTQINALRSLNPAQAAAITGWNNVAQAAANAFVTSMAAGATRGQARDMATSAAMDSAYAATQKAQDAVKSAKSVLAGLPKMPKVAAPAAAKGSGGSEKKVETAAQKAAKAVTQLKDALKSAVASVKDLAAQFKDLVVETGNFAGLFDRPERKTIRGGFLGSARLQIRKLERYRDALKVLQSKVPADVFDLIAAEGVSAMDEVIKLARGGSAAAWAGLIQRRQAVAAEVASITGHEMINTGRAEIIAETQKAREINPHITINFGGVTIGTGMSAEQFGRQLTTIINKELRAAGLVGV